MRLLTTLLALLAFHPGAAAVTQVTEVPVAGAVLRISFSEPVPDTRAAEFSAWLRHVASSVSDVYGRFPLTQVEVRVLIGDARGEDEDSPIPFGRVTRRDGTAVELYIDIERPIAEFYADWTATHEFSHLLLPPVRWQQRWIAEGFASYYQNVLMARAGQYSREEALGRLTAGFARGRASSPELSPNEAARAGMRRARYKIYWSGAAFALLADVRLRERSNGKESLDTVLGRFQQCCLPPGKRWSGPDLFRQFDALLDEPLFMPLYRQHADAPGFPDVQAALANDAVLSDIFAVRTSPN